MNDPWQAAIDFGTSFTAAAIREHNRADVVQLGRTTRVLPSSVLKINRELVVGEAAVNRALMAPEGFVASPKRRLGIDTYVSVDGEDVPVVDLVAAVFDHTLAELFRIRPAADLARIVLTHPAVWADARTTELVRAFERSAASDRLQPELCTEPAAAAFAYVGLDGPDKLIAVYDLGGGTLDTAVLQRNGDGGFELVGAPMGDEFLGGEDFDERIVEHLIEGLRSESPALADELRSSPDPDWANARHLLRGGARQAKEELSSYATYAFRVPAPVSRDLTLTREELNALLRDDIDRSIDILDQSVSNAEALSGTRVESVYLVGGSSRIPAIPAAITRRLGLHCETRENPKEVVSLGATLLPNGVPLSRKVAPPEPPGGNGRRSPRRHEPPPDEESQRRMERDKTATTSKGATSSSPQERSTHTSKRGFSRSLVGLLILVLVAAGAWVAISASDTTGGSASTDGSGTNGVTIDSNTTGGDTADTGGDTTGEDTAESGDTSSADNGPAGTAQVDWVLDGVAYVAILETDGSTGTAEVSYVDPTIGSEVTVIQDLFFDEVDGAYNYTGLNPRDIITGEAAAYYSPDVFWLEYDGGGWYFTEVCSLGRCAPADTSVP